MKKNACSPGSRRFLHTKPSLQKYFTPLDMSEKRLTIANLFVIPAGLPSASSG